MVKDLHVIAIGASAGGLEALYNFFKFVPPDTGYVYIIIRHLKRDHKSIQVKLLAKHTSMNVKSIENGEKIEKNTVYLLPENKKLQIKNKVLYLTDRLASEIINTAIDDFLFSMANVMHKNAIGVILSGLGSDGTKGYQAIEEKGGIMIVQNPSEAMFDGMPKNAIYFDHPNYVLC